jgi:crossover junction endodeoxyribonuclease RuvC
MRVLGIDPGSRSTGWGIVIRENGRYRMIAAGAIQTGEASTPDKLKEIHAGLLSVIDLYTPDCAAIETIFSHHSATSALKLGQARGVALLALAQRDLSIHEYNAMVVKKSVAGTGKAEKEQMGRMVQMLLGVTVEGPHDTADALAIAITHHANCWAKPSIAASEALLGKRPRKTSWAAVVNAANKTTR